MYSEWLPRGIFVSTEHPCYCISEQNFKYRLSRSLFLSKILSVRGESFTKAPLQGLFSSIFFHKKFSFVVVVVCLFVWEGRLLTWRWEFGKSSQLAYVASQLVASGCMPGVWKSF